MNFLQFDINEGDAEAERFQEIQDLLVAAGYFRARIKGLSAFDKASIFKDLYFPPFDGP